MKDSVKKEHPQAGADVVLQEIWRIKDELSASYGHDIHRLFAEARERQKHSGHKVVNLQTKRYRKPNQKERAISPAPRKKNRD